MTIAFNASYKPGKKDEILARFLKISFWRITNLRSLVKGNGCEYERTVDQLYVNGNVPLKWPTTLSILFGKSTVLIHLREHFKRWSCSLLHIDLDKLLLVRVDNGCPKPDQFPWMHSRTTCKDASHPSSWSNLFLEHGRITFLSYVQISSEGKYNFRMQRSRPPDWWAPLEKPSLRNATFNFRGMKGSKIFLKRLNFK